MGIVLGKSKTVSFGLAVGITSCPLPFSKIFQIGKRHPGHLSEFRRGSGLWDQHDEDEDAHLWNGDWPGGAAGAIVSLQWVIFPQMGGSYISKAFAIVVLGGLGNIQGALAGGLIIGILESLVTQYLSAKMAQIIPSMTILIILLLRPTGLFKK